MDSVTIPANVEAQASTQELTVNLEAEVHKKVDDDWVNNIRQQHPLRTTPPFDRAPQDKKAVTLSRRKLAGTAARFQHAGTACLPLASAPPLRKELDTPVSFLSKGGGSTLTHPVLFFNQQFLDVLEPNIGETPRQQRRRLQDAQCFEPLAGLEKLTLIGSRPPWLFALCAGIAVRLIDAHMELHVLFSLTSDTRPGELMTTQRNQFVPQRRAIKTGVNNDGITMDSDLVPFFQSIVAGTCSRTTTRGSPDFPLARLLDRMENSPARAGDDKVPRCLSPSQETQYRVEPADENAGGSAKKRPLVFALLHCSAGTLCTINVVGSHARDKARGSRCPATTRGSVPRSRSGASSARSWWHTIGHCLGGVRQRLHPRARRHAAAREWDRDHVQI